MKLFFFLLILFHLSFAQQEYIIPPVSLPSAPYVEWAHSHFIWLNGKTQTQELLTQLVNDYLQRDIPVGGVNIDSAWSTGYNNFIWNTQKFPNISQFTSAMHEKGIKVICWATSVINTDSSNYQEGFQKGYYLNKGKTIKWWHGKGSFLDYSNPNAVTWWHKQLDYALDQGIDGWKIDGTDPYVIEFVFIEGYKGRISYREYADMYYRDFYYYSRFKKQNDSLIWARGVDSNFYLYLSYAPRDVLVAGWTGDHDGNFEHYGLPQSLRNLIVSAHRGYVNLGSDIGGYRDDSRYPLGRSKENFIRWVQYGAFTSLMENGGGGEHRPWIFDATYKTGTQVTDIYRQFVTIHHELVPYFLSEATEAFLSNTSLYTPMSGFFVENPSTYDYLLGKDIFVAPFVDNTTTRNDITFPKHSDWTDWFNPVRVYKGGSTLASFECPFERFPVFQRVGSIIPLHVSSHYAGHGDQQSQGYVTLLLNYPLKSGKHVRNIYEYNHHMGRRITYEWIHSKKLRVEVSAHPFKPIILLVRGITLSASSQIMINQEQTTCITKDYQEYSNIAVNQPCIYMTSQHLFVRTTLQQAKQGLRIEFNV